MLKPMPTTNWFARSVTLRIACIHANTRLHATPAMTPAIGLFVSHETSAAVKAELSIIPSRLRFSTPARSLSSSPVPASRIGMARRRPDATNTTNASSISGLPCGPGARRTQPPR